MFFKVSRTVVTLVTDPHRVLKCQAQELGSLFFLDSCVLALGKEGYLAGNISGRSELPKLLFSLKLPSTALRY